MNAQIIGARMTVSRDARFTDCHFLDCTIGCDFGVDLESLLGPEFQAVFARCKFEDCFIDRIGSSQGSASESTK